MKKRSITALITATLVAVVLPGGVASAHVLKTDGAIGAVLHIEPDDNPTTGKPTSYILSFTDDTNKLDLSKCDCMVNIKEAGKTISSQPIEVTDPTDSIDSYTFQKPDVYTMEFTGKPKTPGLFQDFKLDYLIRVTGVGPLGGTQPFPVLLWIGLGMVISLVLLGAYAMQHNDIKQNEGE